MFSLNNNNLPLHVNLKKIYEKSLELPLDNFTLCFDDSTSLTCKKLFKRKIFPRTRIIRNNNIMSLKLNKNLNCSVKIYESEVIAVLHSFIIEISQEEYIFNKNANISKQKFIKLHENRLSEVEPFLGVKINDIEYLGYSIFVENHIKNVFSNLDNIDNIDDLLKIEFLESEYKIIGDNFFETFIYFNIKENHMNWIKKNEPYLLALNCENDHLN